MSKLLENKQALHVAGEIAVIGGLAYYFGQQNKTLSAKIDELAKRLGEHEEVITHQAGLIKKLMQKSNTPLPAPVSNKKFTKATPTVTSTPTPAPVAPAPTPAEPVSTTSSFAILIPTPAAEPVESRLTRIEEVVEEEDEAVGEEEDLDKEIEEELAELNLKKEE